MGSQRRALNSKKRIHFLKARPGWQRGVYWACVPTVNVTGYYWPLGERESGNIDKVTCLACLETQMSVSAANPT